MTTPTTTVKADSPAAMLALIPHLVGYEPRNSLVFVTFAGTRSQAILRINLPISPKSAVLKRVATQALGTLCKVPGIDAILPVVYCDEPFGRDAPHRQLADIVVARVLSMGFEVRGALCRASDAWASYLDPTTPMGGRSLADLVAPARLPPLKMQVEPIPDAPAAEKRAMEVEVRRLRALAEDVEAFEDGDPGEELAVLDDVTLFLDDALDWTVERRDQLGPLLLMVVQGPPLRDHTMIQWSTSLEIGDEIWDDGPLLSDRMLGRGPRPDSSRIERGIDLVRYLVSLAVDELRPAPLCMLAWLHWTRGESSAAAACIQQARAIDPEYSMAELLDTVFSSGMLPDWLFDPPPGWPVPRSNRVT